MTSMPKFNGDKEVAKLLDLLRARLTLRVAFLYDELRRALSSAVRAFGLHPKGRPFKSDSAHHP
jgi:hypothetical protein